MKAFRISALLIILFATSVSAGFVADITSGGGTASQYWADILNKPFDTLSYQFFVSGGTLNLNESSLTFTDTNETERVNNLINTDCSGTDKVVGVYPNGTVVCESDVDTDTTYTESTKYLNLTGTDFTVDEAQLNKTIQSQSSSVPQYRQLGTIVGFTSAQYDGNFSNSTHTGYTRMHGQCDTEYEGSHMCFEVEVVNTISIGNYSYSGTSWHIKGAPGFTANANDCQGWTNDDSTYLGAFWNWEGNSAAGFGVLTNCAQTKVVACCA